MSTRALHIAARRVTAMMIAALLASAGAAAAAPAGSTLLVSRPDGSGPVPPAFDNSSKTPGAISDDGRYVVYTSYADGFASGAFSGAVNVFLWDRVTDTTTLVSRSDGLDGAGANRDATAPAIAVDAAGHVLVTFTSSATNLVDDASGQTANGTEQVWLRDVTAGTTTLISRKSGTAFIPANYGGADADQASPIAITPGGPVVAFFASSSSLDGGTGGIFLRTVDAGVTEPISCVNQDCSVANAKDAQAYDPAMRLVGTVLEIAFDSTDTTLTGDPAGHYQVILAEAAAPTSVGVAAGKPGPPFTRISDAAHTPGDGDSTRPAISSDGSDVAFLSTAATLTADSPSPNPGEAYVHDIASDTNTLVSRASGASGEIANSNVGSVALGGAGATLRAAFQTYATNLGAAGTNSQAYVRDLASTTTALLNRASGPAGTLGDGYSGSPVLSTDGSLALLTSLSGNLGLGGGDRFSRVYLRTLPTGSGVGDGTLELISRPSGTAPFMSLTDTSSPAQSGAVSAGGRYVTFSSSSTGLSGQDATNTYVYVRDLLTDRTTLVSRATGVNGAIANGQECEAGGISADGRFVAFSCDATNLSPDATDGDYQVYVRDLVANTTTLVSRANGATGAPASTGAFAEAISADGNVVLIQSSSPLDPAGAGGKYHLYVRDLSTDSTTLVDRDNGASGAAANQDIDEAAIDADGNRVIWTTTAALAGAPSDGVEHAYVRDLSAGTTTLVSRADGAEGASANGDSRDVSIDAAGDIVAFSSEGQNLGATFVNEQVFVRNLTTGHTELVSHQADGVSLPLTAQQPSLDAAGDRLALVEADSGFADPYEVVVVDLGSGATTLASRADGPFGVAGDGSSGTPSLDPSGDCVAFASNSDNLADGFTSSDFRAVHLRVLSGQCPLPASSPEQPTPTGSAPSSPATPRPAKPALTKLRISHHRVHTHGRKRGATITFRLNVRAKVLLRVDQLRRGRSRHHHCIVTAKHGKRCTKVTRRQTIRISARAGANRVRFSGVVHGRRLPPGRYRVTATPRGGKPRSLTFTIVR